MTYVMATEAARFYKEQNKSKCSAPLLMEENMKNIRLRADGTYEARVTVNGKRFSLYSKNYRELQKKMTAFKKQPYSSASGTNFYEYCVSWAELFKKKFVKAKQYKEILRQFDKIKNSAIDIPVSKITTLLLQKYYNTYQKSRAKEILFLYVNAALERAVKDGYFKFNPMSDVVKERKIDNIRLPLTYQQQVALLDEIKDKWIEPYILIYLLTGMRKNEFKIKTIKDDIDENNVLRVLCEKKRDKIVYRFVDLTPETAELIKQAKFVHSIEFVSKEFRKILDKLNINKGYGLHTLRHTFTTNHFYLGTPDKVLQEWLGHEKLEVTKKHYMSIDRSLSKDKILALYPNKYYQF